MNLRKLNEQEVSELEAKNNKSKGQTRAAKAAEYDELALGFDAGEFGEVALADGEKKPTVRKHVAAAFSRRGLSIDWKRGKSDTLRFKVLDTTTSAE